MVFPRTHPGRLRALVGAVGIALLAGLLAACAVRPADAPPAFLLLGEVHDNPEGHARRLTDLRAFVERGWQPAIVMEQFDLDRADDLQAARQNCPDADCIIQKTGGSSRWDWKLYRPVIELALRHDLPLVAGNLSREDARRIVRGGLDAAFTQEKRQAFGLPGSLSPELLSAQQDEVQRGHCNMAPASMLQGLALAQIARDIGMAQAMLQAVSPGASRGAVLIAGNGHVRSDIGVPYWLRQQGAKAVRSMAYVESSQKNDAGRFDHTVAVPPHARPDPCASFRMPTR